jgi:hypothetical protein
LTFLLFPGLLNIPDMVLHTHTVNGLSSLPPTESKKKGL